MIQKERYKEINFSDNTFVLQYNLFMIGLSEYKLYFLQGTDDFVLKELLDKFPDIKIESKDSKKVLFKSKEEDINIFKKLYSPTHIEDSNGKILNLSKRAIYRANPGESKSELDLIFVRLHYGDDLADKLKLFLQNKHKD